MCDDAFFKILHDVCAFAASLKSGGGDSCYGCQA